MTKKNSLKKKIDIVQNQLGNTGEFKNELSVSDSRSMSAVESKMKFHRIKNNFGRAYVNFLVGRKHRQAQSEVRKIKKIETDILEIENVIDKKHIELEKVDAEIRLQNSKINDKKNQKSKIEAQLKDKTTELNNRRQAYNENSKIINKQEAEIRTIGQKLSTLRGELDSQNKTKEWQTEYYDKLVNDKEQLEQKYTGLKKEVESVNEEISCIEMNIEELKEKNLQLEKSLSEEELVLKEKQNDLCSAEDGLRFELNRKKEAEANISKTIFESEETSKSIKDVEKNISLSQNEIITFQEKLNGLLLMKNELSSDLEIKESFLSNKVFEKKQIRTNANEEATIVQELETELAKLDEEERGLNNEVETYSLELERLRIRKKECEDEINQKYDDIAEINQNIGLLNEDISDLEEDTSLLAQELDLKTQEVFAEKEKYKDKVICLEESQNAYDSATAELRELSKLESLNSQKIHLLSENIKSLVKSLEETRAQVLCETNTCEKQVEKIKGLELKIKETEDSIKTENCALKDLKNKILAIHSTIEEKNKSITNLEKELRATHDQVQKDKNEIREVIEKKKSLKERQIYLQSELEDAKSQESKVKHTLLKEEEHLREIVLTENELNHQINSILTNIEDVVKQTEVTSMEISTKNIEIQSAESRLQKIEGDLVGLNNVIKEKKQIHSTRSEVFKNRKAELDSLTKQFSLLTGERKKKEKEISEYENEINSKTSSINTMKESIVAERTSIDHMQSTIRTKQLELSSLKGSFNSLERQTKQNEAQVKRNDERIQDFNRKIEVYKSKILALQSNEKVKNKITKQEEIISDRKSELAALRKTSSVDINKKSKSVKGTSNTERDFEAIQNELTQKYQHSVKLCDSINDQAKTELVQIYKRIVRSFNNLAILNIQSYSVELSSDKNGLVCDITLVKINSSYDYQKEAGGFLRLNPFYLLKAWEEDDKSVNFKLGIEPSFVSGVGQLRPSVSV